MNSLYVISIFSLLSSSALASLDEYTYYPKELIKNIRNSSLQDSDLKEALYKVQAGLHQKTANGHDVIVETCEANATCYKQVRGISYKTARKHLFGQLHLERTTYGSYKIKDLYCNQNIGRSDGAGPMRIPNSKKMNCEHTWPQSRFNPNQSKSLQKTDLHHLYPVSSRANSSRGNHIFAEVNGSAVNDACKASQRGMAIGSSVTAFEPPAEHKGNVARALFYFSMRFKMPIGPLEERYLRQWHELDPVDAKELERNNAIEKIQKNRNPFIDEPGLVAQVNNF